MCDLYWPAHSPDLGPCDFFYQDIIFKKDLKNIEYKLNVKN